MRCEATTMAMARYYPYAQVIGLTTSANFEMRAPKGRVSRLLNFFEKKNKKGVHQTAQTFPRVCLVREKVVVARFGFIWQLLSNHRIINLKRFVSSFTTKLCN